MLKEQITAFTKSFANIHNEEFTKHPSRKLLEDIKIFFEEHSNEYKERNLKIAISIGQGTPALIPWITCISKRADISTT